MNITFHFSNNFNKDWKNLRRGCPNIKTFLDPCPTLPNLLVNRTPKKLSCFAIELKNNQTSPNPQLRPLPCSTPLYFVLVLPYLSHSHSTSYSHLHSPFPTIFDTARFKSFHPVEESQSFRSLLSTRQFLNPNHIFYLSHPHVL